MRQYHKSEHAHRLKTRLTKIETVCFHHFTKQSQHKSRKALALLSRMGVCLYVAEGPEELLERLSPVARCMPELK